MRLRAADVKAHRFLFAMALAIVALPALQLVPLPPQIWSLLPGRELLSEIDRVSGNSGAWRPISLTPENTLNALFATFAPLAMLVLGIRLGADSRRRILTVVLALGALSAAIGLLQVVGDPRSSLYFYDVTNRGSGVGLFANRNHQALLLAMMLPVLAATYALARQDRTKSSPLADIAMLLLALCLLPLILVTGARLGLVAATISLVPSVMLVRGAAGATAPGASPVRSNLLLGLVAALIAGLVALTIWAGRGTAFDRLVSATSVEDMRVLILPTLLAMIGTYFPMGSGMGSFERIYQVHEPDALLQPTYMNHAHNDWLEVLLNAGLFGAGLLAVATAAWCVVVWRAYAPAPRTRDAASLVLGRLGVVLIGLLGLGSIPDYPLRTPSLAALFVIAVLWAAPLGGAGRDAALPGRGTGDTNE